MNGKASQKPAERKADTQTRGVASLRGFKPVAGKQAETGALRNVLAHAGAVAPHSGEPFSEELLFGIGGGMGLGYFVYASPSFVSFFLATRIVTEESKRPGFLPAICERLGLKVTVQNASTPQAAEKTLKKTLEQGRLPIVWVDSMALPYSGPPAAYHTVVVLGFDASQVLVADQSRRPIALTPAELSASRNTGHVRRFPSLVVEAPSKPANVEKAIRLGIRDCVQQMRNGFGPPNFKGNFGLSGLEKWAGLLTHPKDSRGWPKFFPPGPRLYDALLSAFDQIENRGTGGSAFRPMYADFLDEAAGILRRPGLKRVADRFRESGRLWHGLSTALLPNSAPLLKETRQLAAKQRSLFERKGLAAGGEISAIQERLAEIRAEISEAFPLSAAEVQGLLLALRERVLAIHACESEAIAALQAAVR